MDEHLQQARCGSFSLLLLPYVGHMFRSPFLEIVTVDIFSATEPARTLEVTGHGWDGTQGIS